MVRVSVYRYQSEPNVFSFPKGKFIDTFSDSGLTVLYVYDDHRDTVAAFSDWQYAEVVDD